MKTLLLPWIGGALLGLSGVAVLYHLNVAADTPPIAQAPSSDSEAPSAGVRSENATTELAALQAQIDQLKAQAAAQRLAGKAPAEDRTHGIEEDRQRHAAYVAGLQSAFRQERVDPRWAPDATSRVWDAINGNDVMRGAMRNVECRATTCRVEVADDGSGNVNKNLPLWSQQMTDLLPRMVGQQVVGANGQTGTVLYLMAPDPGSARGPRG
ncbi:MAG: hypothetical protein ACREP7_21300 [Lysobacter sp.]